MNAFFHSPENSDEHNWRMLALFSVYRVTLAAAFLTLFAAGLGPSFLGRHSPLLFAVLSIAYVIVTLFSAALAFWRKPSYSKQAGMALLLDMLFLVLLMHSSGGISSGLGMLLIIPVVFFSSVVPGRYAVFAAALCASAILGEQVYAAVNQCFTDMAFTPAGILGAAFFTVALLATSLSRRARENELLADQHMLDLANMEQLNAFILQHMETGVLVVDEEQNVRMMNEAAWYFLGLPERWKEAPLAKLSADLFERLQSWMADKSQSVANFRVGGSGVTLQPVFKHLGQSMDAGALIFLEDAAIISQRAQQMKLASLGRLTASIAHEIRNPLGAVSHAGQLLQESPALDEADKRLLQIIDNNSERVNQIIENVLQLSRRSESNAKRITLRSYVEKFVAQYLRNYADKKIDIQIEFEPGDIDIEIDTSQMDQVLINLLDNAIEHSSPDERGRVFLHVMGGQERRLGGAYLDVIDNGPGVDPSLGQQVFEPFFTTRQTGSGLGLYIARELCESNRALLEYVPMPQGKGSCFRILFMGQVKMKASQ